MPVEVDNRPAHPAFDLDLNFEGDGDLIFNEPMDSVDNGMHALSSAFNTPRRLKRKVTPDVLHSKMRFDRIARPPKSQEKVCIHTLV